MEQSFSTKDEVKKYLESYKESLNMYEFFRSKLDEGDLKGVSFDESSGTSHSCTIKWDYYIEQIDKHLVKMQQIENFIYHNFKMYEDLDIISRRYLMCFDSKVVADQLSITTSAVRKRIDKAIERYLEKFPINS